MKRCFAYVRVSTAKQGEGVSLEAQQDAIAAYAARNDLSIIQWFEEQETAAKSGRPIFNAMLKQLKADKASGLIIHKIDRSARNFADWAKVGDLADAGIDVHFASESLDFRSRGGRLSADIQAVIAADYVRNLREETIKGINGRLKQGLYPFNAPVGYLDNGKGKLKTPDPERAPLVKEMFDLYASGQYCLKSLVVEMEKRGLRNRSNRPLSRAGIGTVLSNPFYCGIIKIKTTGDTYKGRHQPLISVTTFERVQAIKAGKSSKKITRHNYVFRGLFRCGLCNAAMTPERQKGHVYYRCHTSNCPTKTVNCPTKTVREEALDNALLFVLKRCEFSKRQIDIVDRRVRAWLDKETASEKPHTWTLQLAKIEARLSSLDDKLIDNVIDEELYKSKRERYLLEKAAIQEAEKKSKERAHKPRYIRRFLELIKSLYRSYIIANDDEKREIVDLATSNRRVSLKNIAIELRDWFVTVDQAVTVLAGPPDRTTSRSSRDMRNKHIDQLIEAANSAEAADLLSRLDTSGEVNVDI